MLLTDWLAPLRAWQTSTYLKWLEAKPRDFLIVATPGAGKTMIALRIAFELLSSRKVTRVVLVVPTDNLRKQWADAAARNGVQLDPQWAAGNGPESRDFHGVAVTYQAVAQNSAVFRAGCGAKTLVIFDEIHHAGDEKAWGEGLKHAFEVAEHRIALSGTPFRTDGTKIPFVRYDHLGCCIADAEYSYEDALQDGVCRLVLFPSFEGDMQWFYRSKRREATFAEVLGERDSNHRLNTALSPSSDWVAEVIRAAHAKLLLLRQEGHATAAGLIVAKDQDHARALAGLLKLLTGVEPGLVISDDRLATDKLRQFALSHDLWIIAVRMVSEGADIPRFRVGIYATNITTEIYFRQFVGRFVRTVPDLDEQTAYVYIPADERLCSFAQTIRDEVEHFLAPAKEDEPEQGEEEYEYDSCTTPSSFIPLRADNPECQGIIHEDQLLSLNDIACGASLATKAGFAGKLNDLDRAALGRLFREAIPTTAAVPVAMPVASQQPLAPPPKYTERNHATSKLKAKTAHFANSIGDYLPSHIGRHKRFAVVNTLLGKATKKWAKDAKGIADKQARIRLLEEWSMKLREAQEEGRPRAWLSTFLQSMGV